MAFGLSLALSLSALMMFQSASASTCDDASIRAQFAEKVRLAPATEILQAFYRQYDGDEENILRELSAYIDRNTKSLADEQRLNLAPDEVRNANGAYQKLFSDISESLIQKFGALNAPLFHKLRAERGHNPYGIQLTADRWTRDAKYPVIVRIQQEFELERKAGEIYFVDLRMDSKLNTPSVTIAVLNHDEPVQNWGRDVSLYKLDDVSAQRNWLGLSCGP